MRNGETVPNQAVQKNGLKLPRPDIGGGLYELQRLREIHHNVLRLVAVGVKQKDVAKALGVTEVMVSYTVNSTLGKQKLKILRQEADQSSLDMLAELQQLVPGAIALQEKVLFDENEKTSTRLRAAEDILDRAGPSKKQRTEHSHQLVSSEEIAEARKLALQGAKDAGILVDVEDATVIDDDED